MPKKIIILIVVLLSMPGVLTADIFIPYWSTDHSRNYSLRFGQHMFYDISGPYKATEEQGIEISFSRHSSLPFYLFNLGVFTVRTKHGDSKVIEAGVEWNILHRTLFDRHMEMDLFQLSPGVKLLYFYKSPYEKYLPVVSLALTTDVPIGFLSIFAGVRGLFGYSTSKSLFSGYVTTIGIGINLR
jgi:hypothetical protein